MRDFAQIHLAIWNDDDFRDLSPRAQLLFFMLISHPTLSRCGVGEWKPAKLACLSPGWTKQGITVASHELIHHQFILVDEDAEEVLVRSFVRNDGVMKQKNLATTMARAFSTVASPEIRGVIVWELNRLHDEDPELSGWGSGEALRVLSKRSVDPASYPLGDPSSDPSDDPPIDPQRDPSIDPKVDPRVDPSVEGERQGAIDPSVDPSHITVTATGNSITGTGQVRATGDADGGERAGVAPSPEKIPDEWVEIPSLARCTKHRNADNPPPCPKCKQVRLASEKLRDEREASRQAAARSRRTAIDNCGLCDEHGIARVPGGRTRCPHDQEQLAQLHAQAQADIDARAQAEQERAEKANSPETVQGRWRRKREATTHILDPHEPLPPNTHIIDAEPAEKHTETDLSRDNTPPPDTHPNKWQKTPQNPKNKDTT